MPDGSLCGADQSDVCRILKNLNKHVNEMEEKNMSKVQVMDHPLIQHKVNYIRRKEVGSKEFREIVGEIAALMCYEATRDLKLQDVEMRRQSVRWLEKN